MSQTKVDSVKESVTDTLVSYLFSLAIQQPVYWAHGIEVTAVQNATLAAYFVGFGLARRYFIRRYFNRRET